MSYNILRSEDVEVDYRIIYTDFDIFKKGFLDAYIGSSTKSRPPYFEDLLEMMLKEVSYFYFLQHRHEFTEIDDSQVDNYIKDLLIEETTALNYAFTLINTEYIELFSRDLYLYILSSGTLILSGEYGVDMQIINNPFEPIW